MPADLLATLESAINGLLYMSETDSPFEIVHWKKRGPILSSADVLSFIGQSSGMHIEEYGLDEFFQDLIQDQNWHKPDDKKTVEKYRNLLAVLKDHLADLKVFEVGEVEIDIYDIYIVGRTAEGDWAGVMTTAVET